MRFAVKLILTFVLLVLASSASASHIIGGHITYYAVDSVNYKVYATVYRDCSGISTGQLNLRVEYGSTDTSFSGTLVSTGQVLQRPASCNLGTRCNGGSLYDGFEVKVFEYSVNLSGISECQIRFSLLECCRISTLNLGGADEDFYIYTDLNKCVGFTNRSLTFSEGLPFMIKAGDDKVMSFAGSDTTGLYDSVTYELTPPLSNDTTQVQYSSGYNYLTPIRFVGYPNKNLLWPAGFRFGQHTGNLIFRPSTANQITTLSVKITGWKKINGVMQRLTTMHRNHTIYTFGNSTTLGGAVQSETQLNGNKVPYDEIKYLCADDTALLELSLRPLNSAVVSHRYLPFSPMIEDTSFVVNSVNQKLQLTFLPDSQDIADRIQLLHLRVEDQQCSVVSQGWQYAAIPFVIVPGISEAKKPTITATSGCNSISLRATDTHNLKLLPIQWTYKGQVKTGDSVHFIVQDTGWHYFTYSLDNRGPCKLTVTDSFRFTNLSTDKPSIFTSITEDCVQDFGWLVADSSQDVKHWYLGLNYSDTLDFPATYFLPQKNQYLSVIVDSQNCYFVDTLNFRVNNTPRLLSKGTQNHCVGNIKSLLFNSVIDSTHGIGPYTYYFNNQVSSLDSVFYPQQNQTVARRLVDQIGCTYYDTVYIVKNAAFTVYAGEDTTTCLGNAIQLNGQYSSAANPVVSRLWDDTASALSRSYTYTGPKYVKLQIQRNDGCTIADSFYISDYTGYQATIVGDSVVCYGNDELFTTSYSGGTAYQSIEWAYGNVNSAADSLITMPQWQNGQTQLMVKITDSAQCIAYDTLQVHFRNPRFTLNTATRPLCSGERFTLKPSTLNGLIPTSYNWNSGQSNSDSLVYIGSSTYGAFDTIRLAITDNFGCVSDTFTTLELSSFQAKIDAYPLVCGGDSIRVKANYSGALGSLTYDWEIGSLNFSDSDFFFVPTAGLNYQIKMNLRDANGCLISDSFDFVTTNFQVGLSGDTLLCVGESANILATPRLGPGPFAFQWTGTGIANDSVFHIDNSSYTRGQHLIAVQVSDANNCMASDSLVLVNNTFAAPPLNDISLCFGDSLLLSSQDTAASGNAQYTWTINGQTYAGNSLQHGPLPEQVYSLILHATDAQLCSIKDTVVIDVRELKAHFIGNLTTCGGDTINLSYQASGNFGSLNQDWIVDGIFFSNASQVQFTDTAFQVKHLRLTLMDANQCEMSLNDSLRFYRQTQIDFTSPGFCEDAGNIVLQNYAQPDGGLFKDAMGTVQTLVSSQSVGRGNHLYTYIAGDAGCEDSSNFTLYIHPEPQISFYSFDTIGIQNHQTIFFASIIAQQPKLEWDFGDGNTLSDSLTAKHTYVDTGYFDVTLKVVDSVCTKRLTKSNYVYVLDSQILRVESPELIEMALYPNPLSQGSLNVSVSERIDFVSVQTIQGQEIFKTGTMNPGVHQMDLSKLVTGTYVLIAQRDNRVRTFKLIKLEHKQH